MPKVWLEFVCSYIHCCESAVQYGRTLVHEGFAATLLACKLLPHLTKCPLLGNAWAVIASPDCFQSQ